MSKYKAGDKIVLEILSIDCDVYYKVGGEFFSWWENPSYLDKVSEPLSEYTEKLEKKNQNKQKRIEKLVDRLHRQAAEITRLLAENAELKEKLHEEHHELVWQDGYSQGVSSESEKWNENMKIIRDNAFEAGRIRGNEEAWELARKIVFSKSDGGYSTDELNEIFDNRLFCEVLKDNTYSEAAAKVAEWERKNEICVGDVVTFYGKFGLVTCIDQHIRGISENGIAFAACKEDCTKTGRHIDVDAWLAQIGGESDDI